LVYSVEDDLLKQSEFNTFQSRDVLILTRDKRYVGLRVTNGLQQSFTSSTDLWGSGAGIPSKGFWYSHNAAYGQLYGRSQLRPAWRYWRRLRGRDGIEEIADLGLYRMGAGYIISRYPDEDLKGKAGNVPGWAGANRVPSKDVARQLVQTLKSGAGIALPSTKYPSDQGGDYKWTVEVENPNINLGQLTDRENDMAQKISRSVGWPPELMDAAETGSGFSGRLVPFLNLLNNKTRLVSIATNAWNDQVNSPLLKWNYGPNAWAKFTATPLTEVFKKMGVDPNNPPGQSSSPGVDLPQPGAEEQPGVDAGGDGPIDPNDPATGAAPEGEGGEPLDEETKTVFLAYLDALIDAKSGDKLAEREVERLREMLTEGDLSMLDGEPDGANLSGAGFEELFAGTWTKIPAGTVDEKSGRKSRKDKWKNPETGRVIYHDPGQPRQKKPTPLQTKKASARETFSQLKAGVRPTPEQAAALLDRMQHLTVPELRKLRQTLAASWGEGKAKNKEAMVKALRAHLRAELESQGVSEQEPVVPEPTPRTGPVKDEEILELDDSLAREVDDELGRTEPEVAPDVPEPESKIPTWNDRKAKPLGETVGPDEESKIRSKHEKYRKLLADRVAEVGEGYTEEMAREDAQWESGLTDAELARAERPENTDGRERDDEGIVAETDLVGRPGGEVSDSQGDGGIEGGDERGRVDPGSSGGSGDSDPLTKGLRAAEIADMPDDLKRKYAESYRAVLGRIPAKARAEMAANLGEVRFFDSPAKMVEDIRQTLLRSDDPALRAEAERMRGESFRGAYIPDLGKGLWVDGGTEAVMEGGYGDKLTTGAIQAHEIAHVLDAVGFDEKGQRLGKFSSTPEWLEASQEVYGPQSPLSSYAQTDAQEAFGEFGRLVLGGEVALDSVERSFPKMSAFWKGNGIWPETSEGGSGETKLPEIFDEKVPIGDGHADTKNGSSPPINVSKVSYVPRKDARKGETMIMVDPAKLDTAWADRNNRLPKEGEGVGESEVPGRRDEFRKFLETGKPIEASRGRYEPKSGRFGFEDGRHRFAVMRDAGAKEVGVMVPNNQAKLLQDKFGSKSLAQPTEKGPNSAPPKIPEGSTEVAPLPGGAVELDKKYGGS